MSSRSRRTARRRSRVLPPPAAPSRPPKCPPRARRAARRVQIRGRSSVRCSTSRPTSSRTRPSWRTSYAAVLFEDSPPERPERPPRKHRLSRRLLCPQVHHNPWEALQHMKWGDALNRVDKRLAYMSPAERMSTREWQQRGLNHPPFYSCLALRRERLTSSSVLPRSRSARPAYPRQQGDRRAGRSLP